ncbi:protein phosphatase 2C domain-containing protein [Streptomyces pakalii]|uniref:protein phosphatase 2C domain-containing protein n=1 Tax=Streptomyces pakalii TaxID=3036494 RepID=UPI0037D9C8D8
MQIHSASEARPHGINEDFVLSGPGVAVVLDGAGMAPGMESGCCHGVPWFVGQLGTRLYAEVSRKRSPLSECLAEAIEETADLHRGQCALDDPHSPSATVAVARTGDDLFEWLVLGDCTAVVEAGQVVRAVTDDRLAKVAPRARKALAAAEPGSEHRKEAHRALVEEERGYLNTPGGYWVAATDPAAAGQALNGVEDARIVKRAALLTDGAARLVTTIGAIDWPGYLELLTYEGPEQAIRRVREAERSDPDLTRWPRSKQHDDATVALLGP